MEVTSDQLLHIQSVIDDLRERIHGIKNLESVQEINSYCDDLESEVMLTTESAIKHLNELEKEMLNEINDYRHGLLLATQLHPNDKSGLGNVTDELSEISNQIDQLSLQISVHLDQSCQREEAGSLTVQGNELTARVKEAQRKARRSRFKGDFWSFQPNWTFLIERHHLGRFKHSNEDVLSMPSQSKLTLAFDFALR